MACPHPEKGVERSKLSEYAAAWQTTGDTFAGRGRFDLDQPLYKFWLEVAIVADAWFMTAHVIYLNHWRTDIRTIANRPFCGAFWRPIWFG